MLRKSPGAKRRQRIDRARQKPLAERAERDESNPELLERRQHVSLRLSVPQRVFALHRGQRLNGVRATNRRRTGFRQAEVLDLALLNQLLDGAGDILDRHTQIDAVLIEQVDRVDAKALQRRFGDFLDVLRPAVHVERRLAGTDVRPELRRDGHLPLERFQRLADELLVREGPVNLGGVEEREPLFNGCPDQLDAVPAVERRTVAEAQAHAAEAERRHFQVAEFALLHERYCARTTSSR